MAVYWRPSRRNSKEGKAGEGVYWYSFVFAGKRIQESAHTTRRTVAAETEKRRRLELERAFAGLPVEDARKRILSVSDVIKPYREHYGINHRPKSVMVVRGTLAQVEKRLGPVLLSDLSEQRIRAYIQARLNDGASGRTINMELGELSRAIGRTWRELWPKVRKLEERKDVGRALTPDEEDRLLSAAAGDISPNRNRMLYTFLRVALATGMRSGEIIALRWSQMDLERHIITVGRAKTASGTGRQIPMNGELQMVMNAHASWYAQTFGDLRPDWYVFPGRAGRPQFGVPRPLVPTRPTTTVTKSWEALRTKAGVSCRLHDLRHTAATKMAEAGVSESTMLSIMGHMSRAMLERYSHIRMAAKREAVEAMTIGRRQSVPSQVSTKSTTVIDSARVA